MTYLPSLDETATHSAHHVGTQGVASWLRMARGFLKQRGASATGLADPDTSADGASIHLDGQGKTLSDATRTRLLMFALGLALVYGVIGVRLVDLALDTPDPGVRAPTPQEQIAAHRPDIVDRNGVLLATDVPATAVYADPSVLVDVDDAVDRLSVVLPDLPRDALRQRLDTSSRFEWIARDLTPAERGLILQQGIPGVGFLEESRRFYPSGRLAAHVLGAVNVDHEGLEGMERYLDEGPLGELEALGGLDR